ncbi:MAG: hypothetical protein AAFN16_06820 [Pseudomonadota bacterium]
MSSNPHHASPHYNVNDVWIDLRHVQMIGPVVTHERRQKPCFRIGITGQSDLFLLEFDSMPIAEKERAAFVSAWRIATSNPTVSGRENASSGKQVGNAANGQYPA